MVQRSNVNPPDVCLFRVESAVDYVTCGSLDDTFGITALGTRDGAVGVHSLDATKRPLYRLRTQIDFEEEVDEISELFDVNNPMERVILYGHIGQVNATCFSPCGNFALSAGQDGSTRLWSRQLWQELYHVTTPCGSNAPMYDVHMGDDSYFFVTASSVLDLNSRHGVASLFCTERKIALRVFAPSMESVYTALVHANGGYVVTGGDGRCVRVYDVRSSTPVRQLPGHNAPIVSLALSSDGRLLASGGLDGGVVVHDFHASRTILTYRSPELRNSAIVSLTFSPKSNELAVGTVTGGLHIIDLDIFAQNSDEVLFEQSTEYTPDIICKARLCVKNSPIYALRYSPDDYLAVLAADGRQDDGKDESTPDTGIQNEEGDGGKK